MNYVTKRRIAGITLPAVAGLALTGTGFGLWVFQNDLDAKTAEAHYEVTAAVSAEKLAAKMTDDK